MTDINERFNVRSTIKYYNVIHIKDNIYETEGKGNYFRLVTLKTLYPNDREFCSYDIAETLDKDDSYVEFGQRIIVFEHHISLQDWIQQQQLVIGHRLNQELMLILWFFCNTYFIYFLMFFYFIYFYLVNIYYPVTCLKLFNTWYHKRN